MQDATIMEATYLELEAGLDAFVEAVSDLLTAERIAQECEIATPGGLTSLARAKWARLRALEGESLRAWIGAEVERAHSTILAACERIGCVFPEDQPEAVRRAVGLAGRVADSLLTVASRADLRRMAPTLLDTLEGLCKALEPLEAAPAPSPRWSKDELIAATAGPGVREISDNTLLRVLRHAGLRGTRGKKGRSFGRTELQRLIDAAPDAITNEAERCVRAWTALLNRTG
ncbi:MAG: hypothetical protein ACT4PL_07320 [Phycisphaerales bacterium]